MVRGEWKTGQLVEDTQRRAPLSDVLIKEFLQSWLLLSLNMRGHIVVHVAPLGEAVDETDQLRLESVLALKQAEVIRRR